MDADNATSELKEISGDPRLGANPAQRMETLRKFQRYDLLLTLLSVLLCFWAWFYPRPYLPLIVALALLPWIAVLVAHSSHGLMRIDEKPKQVRPSIASAIIFPGMILTLRCVYDFNHLQTAQLWIGLSLITVLLTLALILVDKTARQAPRQIALFFAFNLAYGYGTVIQADIWFDSQPGQQFRTVVTRKEILHHKGTYYRLHLLPWGPIKGSNELDVTQSEFEAIDAGSQITLTLRPGALQIPWYDMEPVQR